MLGSEGITDTTPYPNNLTYTLAVTNSGTTVSCGGIIIHDDKMIGSHMTVVGRVSDWKNHATGNKPNTCVKDDQITTQFTNEQ